MPESLEEKLVLYGALGLGAYLLLPGLLSNGGKAVISTVSDAVKTTANTIVDTLDIGIKGVSRLGGSAISGTGKLIDATSVEVNRQAKEFSKSTTGRALDKTGKDVGKTVGSIFKPPKRSHHHRSPPHLRLPHLDLGHLF